MQTNEPEQQRRWGKGMIIAAWITALALMTLLFEEVLNRQINPNPSPNSRSGASGVVEVVLQRNRAGHYVASGEINGHPVVFLLDTGATSVAMPASVAHRVGAPLGEVRISRTAAGDVPVYSTRLEQVSLGGITRHQVSASVLDRMEGDKVLLGMSFLKHLELLQRGDTLTLRHYPEE